MVKTKLRSTLGLQESRGRLSPMLPHNDNKSIHLPLCPTEAATKDKQTECWPSKAAHGCHSNLM